MAPETAVGEWSRLSFPCGAGRADGFSARPCPELFTWRPALAQSPSTQAVTVVVSDSGLPSMSATQSFLVAVARPVLPTLTMASVTNGQFGVWVNGDSGPDYTIQVSTNLESWAPAITLSSPALPCFWSNTNSGSSPMQFYRALLGP